MAKCKDCSKEVGFLKKRCTECDALFKEQEAVRKAEQAERDREALEAARKQKEDSRFQNALNGLDVTWDKFENKGSIRGHTFKPYGSTTFTFSCVNNAYFWLVATQTQPDWDWLEDNRTIILFDDGARFIQESDSLRATDVTTNWADEVVCYEEHHIEITDSIPTFEKFYETYKYESYSPPVLIRIGRHEYQISFDEIRELVAISTKAQESN